MVGRLLGAGFDFHRKKPVQPQSKEIQELAARTEADKAQRRAEKHQQSEANKAANKTAFANSPPPIPDQAINKVSSTPLAPLASSVNSAPTENPYLKKEPTKDVRSEAKEASQKRMSKLWEQKDSSMGEQAKTPDLGETFKSMFGGGNAQDAKKQQKEKALKTLMDLE